MTNSVVTGFTWKILEDSGWYGPVDPSLWEPYNTGKGRGCAWRDACHNSQNDDFFCKRGGEDLYTFDKKSKGYCG